MNINIPVFQICSRNNKTLSLYACEVIYLIIKGVISPHVQEQGGMLLKFNILRLHYVTHYWSQNWIPAFLKQPWNIKRSTLFAISKNNLENFEKQFSMIQSGCSIYSHFLKPLHWNSHELWHKVPIVMKITVHPLRHSNWTLDLLFVFLKFSWLLGYNYYNNYNTHIAQYSKAWGPQLY